MWSFTVVVLVLIVLVMAMILPTLQRPQTQLKSDKNAERRAVFLGQFEELAQDKASGVLTETQYAVAKTELERRMLQEIGRDAGSQTIVTAPDKRLAYLLAVLIPFAALAIYHKIGQPDAIKLPRIVPAVTGTQSSAEHNLMGGDIEPLLNSLKAKLETRPEDGDGWALLARTYVELGRHSEAVTAYEKATQLIKDDPQLLADYADALAVVNGHSLAGKPEDLVNSALKLDPHHVKALMLAGTAEFDSKNYTQAIEFWQRLQKILPADSDLMPEVNAALNETYAITGQKPPKATATFAESPDQKMSDAASISGIVKISPKLADKFKPSDTLFVFARPTHGAPMPLAIVRATAIDLPYQFKLDDSAALMPSHKLSQADEVVLVARLSKSGDAKSQPGDLQGMSQTVKLNETNVTVEINQVIN